MSGIVIVEENVDILPNLSLMAARDTGKEGDSYGAHANCSTESLRWVPAADGMTAPFTRQAIRAVLTHPAEASAVSCPSNNFIPRPRILIAPTTSAWFS